MIGRRSNTRITASRWRRTLHESWRLLKGERDFSEMPPHLVTIDLMARCQSDILREAWRYHHSADEACREVMASIGGTGWRPKSDRYTMLWVLLRALLRQRLNGAIAECGVYRGATARLIASTMDTEAVSKPLYLLDTFAGLPKPTDGLDGSWKQGDLGDANLDAVRALLRDVDYVRFMPGLFKDTLPTISTERFCFVHVDCDLYQSVLDCIDFFYTRVVSGGFIVLDDHGVPYCPGAKAAVEEYLRDKPELPIYLPTGQAFIIKNA